MNFKGKVALVTGGTSGIGEATVVAFAKAGANVVFCGTNADRGAALVKRWQSEGRENIFFHQADVAREADVAALVDSVLDRFGRLDCAVNSAGIYQFETPPITELDVDYWNRILAVDLTGMFLCMKHQVRAMLQGGGGAIVNIGSGAGLKAVPQTYAYVAAKHGLIGLSKTAALDLATQNVRVNVVCPGLVQTPMVGFLDTMDEASKSWFFKANAQERIGQPEEIADAALWLCSDGASFTTGVILPVDGGYSIK